MSAFLTKGRVAFHETDAARMVHFSNYFRYAEEAELAALASCSFFADCLAAQCLLPRVHVEADYHRPLRFWDEYETHASLERIGASSLTWCFEIHGADGLMATLRWVTVRLDAQAKKWIYSEAERAQLAAFLR